MNKALLKLVEGRERHFMDWDWLLNKINICARENFHLHRYCWFGIFFLQKWIKILCGAAWGRFCLGAFCPGSVFRHIYSAMAERPPENNDFYWLTRNPRINRKNRCCRTDNSEILKTNIFIKILMHAVVPKSKKKNIFYVRLDIRKLLVYCRIINRYT